jgi:hypothetical protein
MGSGRSGLYIRTHGHQQAIEALNAGGNTRIIPGTNGIVIGGSPTTLGKKLLQGMGVTTLQKWSGYQAHHIIPKQLENHPIIKKMGMELDNPSNGMFLRIPGENVSARSRHRGYHSAYTKFVKQELDKININSTVHSLQIQVYALQLKLRALQRSGLPMYESNGASIDLWTRYLNKLK